jgi:hypothetical protein
MFLNINLHAILTCVGSYLASNLTKDVQSYESLPTPNQLIDFHSFGSVGLGLNPAIEAWMNIHQVFYSEAQPYGTAFPGHPEALFMGYMERLGHTILEQYPVELLLMGDLTA